MSGNPSSFTVFRTEFALAQNDRTLSAIRHCARTYIPFVPSFRLSRIFKLFRFPRVHISAFVRGCSTTTASVKDALYGSLSPLFPFLSFFFYTIFISSFFPFFSLGLCAPPTQTLSFDSRQGDFKRGYNLAIDFCE